jgi:hypothetical protein
LAQHAKGSETNGKYTQCSAALNNTSKQMQRRATARTALQITDGLIMGTEQWLKNQGTSRTGDNSSQSALNQTFKFVVLHQSSIANVHCSRQKHEFKCNRV